MPARCGAPILDYRTLFAHRWCAVRMSRTFQPGNSGMFHVKQRDCKHSAKILTYPDGSYDLICSTAADFGHSGWEEQKPREEPPRSKYALLGWTGAGKLRIRDLWELVPDLPARHIPKERRCADPEGEDRERAMRRARANVRRYALANDFTYFVTLTLDPKKVERKDPEAVVKKLSSWAHNMVNRHGLRYILVPEYHKKGGIHFHGFFNDIPALKAVDSGHVDKQGHTVYNLAGWKLGFTTAIKLYGDYHAAVAYTCKYIGKDSEKIGGRWYYSGGDLKKPEETFVDLTYRDVLEEYGSLQKWQEEAAAAAGSGVEIPPPSGPVGYEVQLPGRRIVVVNGVRPEESGNHDSFGPDEMSTIRAQERGTDDQGRA